MERYFVHLQNSRPFTPKDAAVLLARAREAVPEGVIIRDARVSKKYVEFDTSIPDRVRVESLIDSLTKISPLASYEQIVEKHMPKEEAIRKAVELFNDEKYWGAHELLEGVWKATPKGEERNWINGIILVAAAFVHDTQDEPQVCISILARAMKKLESATGSYYGIDMDRLVTLVSQILQTGRIERFTI